MVKFDIIAKTPNVTIVKISIIITLTIFHFQRVTENKLGT